MDLFGQVADDENGRTLRDQEGDISSELAGVRDGAGTARKSAVGAREHGLRRHHARAECVCNRRNGLVAEESHPDAVLNAADQRVPLTRFEVRRRRRKRGIHVAK